MLSVSYFLVFTLGWAGASVLLVVSVGAITGIGWALSDDEETSWEAAVDLARRVSEWAGLVEPKVIVEGAIHHRDVVWICQYFRDGNTDVEYRACPSCQIELVERHTGTDGGPATVSADGGTTRDVLVCPHCAFEKRGQKHETAEKDAVLSRFRRHIDEMRRGDDPEMPSRYESAARTLGMEPTPADVWDEYVQTAADDHLRKRNASSVEETARHPTDTYPEFAELRRKRDVRDRVVEFLPAPLDWVVAELSLSEYLEEKQRLKRDREAAREAFQEANERFRNRHREVVSEISRARAARDWPDASLSASEREQLQADRTALAAVESNRRRYLTGAEVRRITALERQCDSVRAYDRLTSELRAGLDAVEDALGQFEREYGSYDDHDAYLDQRTEQRLRASLSTVEDRVQSLETTMEECDEPVPSDARDTVAKYETRCRRYRAALDGYEADFVREQRDAYPGVFEVDGDELNHQQALAVVRNEPRNLVDASAGTGKTLSLTQRFLYLYRTGVPLEEVVALTYTGEATEEMTERLGEALDGVSQSRLQVDTINGLARSIVSRSIEGTVDRETLKSGTERFLRRAFAGDQELRELAPDEMDAFDRHCQRLERGEYDELMSPKADSEQSATETHVRTVFEAARNFGASPAELRDMTDRGDRLEFHLLHATAALVGVYRALADDREHPIDHTNSIERATAVLKRYDERYADEYAHVLVDEFQDLSPQTLAFVQQLLGPETHLYAVGDDWQSIFGFQGASPEFFREFESRFEQTSRTTLERNYRCPEPVVEASVSLMADAESATEKTVEADADGGPPPVVHRLERPFHDRQGAYIADLVEDYVAADGNTYADVQVLVSNTTLARERIGPHLVDRDIPVDVQKGRTDTGPTVRVQTFYKSKGTQADCVILANVVDDEYGGLPETRRDPVGVDAIRASGSDHYAEQRRLFYVGLTRTRDQLHVVTRDGSASRFVDAIAEHFEVVAAEFDGPVAGTVTAKDRSNGRGPHSLTLDMGEFETGLVTFDDDVFEELEEGCRYRFTDLDVNTFRPSEEFKVPDTASYAIRD